MKLKRINSTRKAFPDLLNYGSLVAPGVVLGKDGSLVSGWMYRGEDNEAITHEEINSFASRVNDKLRVLGSGWTLQVDAIRVATGGYPHRERMFFEDPVTALIDEERRMTYGDKKQHFETEYAMTLTYLPPKIVQSKVEGMIYRQDETLDKKQKLTLAERNLIQFNEWADEFTSSFQDILSIRRLSAYTVPYEDGELLRDELVEFLNICISNNHHPINIQAEIPFLDGVLGAVDFIAGVEPIVDGKFLSVVGITGFPQETYPGVLDILDTLPVEYRWSSRFIYMDPEQAKSQLNKFRRKWKQKERGMIDQITGKQTGSVDQFAQEMTMDSDEAISYNSSQLVRFGYYTTVVVLFSKDPHSLKEAATGIVRSIRNLGFMARVENINTIEAYLGSLPGHSYLNVRRPLIHTMNLTDLLPLSAVWPGQSEAPCDKYPADSPALIYVETKGSTVFRLNLHVGDLGHTLIFGPTGAGKSTLLAVLAAQFARYKGSTFYGFDKGWSLYCLTEAAGGDHYALADESSALQFCPLATVKTTADLPWAEEWIRTCAELQLRRPLIPSEKAEIHQAMKLLMTAESKTITEFNSILQSHELKEALDHYSVDGPLGSLLDADEDSLDMGKFVCFETETLMDYADEDKLPVLLYIFKRIEDNLQGQPAMIMLDEAWVMLGHEAFREKIRAWLKVLRKNNCAVVMATQSLSDASKSGIVDVLVESCPTKIFLPNPAAKSDFAQKFYEEVGLNLTQIELLSRAVQKRDYYAVSPEGNRLFNMALGPVALAFVAQSGKLVKTKIDLFKKKYGAAWQRKWLQEHDVPAEFVELYDKLFALTPTASNSDIMADPEQLRGARPLLSVQPGRSQTAKKLFLISLCVYPFGPTKIIYGNTGRIHIQTCAGNLLMA